MNRTMFQDCISSSLENAACFLSTDKSESCSSSSSSSSSSATTKITNNTTGNINRSRDSQPLKCRPFESYHLDTSCSSHCSNYIHCYSEHAPSRLERTTASHENSVYSPIVINDLEEAAPTNQDEKTAEEQECDIAHVDNLEGEAPGSHHDKDERKILQNVAGRRSFCDIDAGPMSSLLNENMGGIDSADEGQSLDDHYLSEKTSTLTTARATLKEQYEKDQDFGHPVYNNVTNDQHDSPCDDDNRQDECICNHHDDYDKPTITARFSDIIGHGAAKLRLDEMLIPLALPSSLADRILTGKSCSYGFDR